MSRPGTAWDRHEDAGWRETGDRVVDCRIMNDSMVRGASSRASAEYRSCGGGGALHSGSW